MSQAKTLSLHASREPFFTVPSSFLKLLSSFPKDLLNKPCLLKIKDRSNLKSELLSSMTAQSS